MVLSLPRGTARLAAVLDALPDGFVPVRPGDGTVVTAGTLLHGVSVPSGEADPLRSRPRTEAILRAATEGIVCTDADGRITLVNPAFTQILGHPAGELDGVGLHPLILPERPDGTPFPYEESPLADTLRSGRKHRVRDQVLRSRSGERVPVDLTTAPVRDGDRLVGAVMTFTDRRPHEQLTRRYTAELGALTDRVAQHAAEREAQAEKYAALAARSARLTAVLAKALRGELGRLSESLLDHQRLEEGTAVLAPRPTALDALVTAAVHRAAVLTGPHDTRFAVHAPPVAVPLDPGRATTALAHLIADASGFPSSGPVRPGVRPGTTVTVTAGRHGDTLRVEVRGLHAADDPVHTLIASGIVEAHGGRLTARPLPGGTGLAHVVELPHAPAPAALPAAAVAVRSRDPRPAPVPAPVSRPTAVPVPVPRPAPAPVAGSWIIGAAVRARHARPVGDLPVRPRPVPVPPPSVPRLSPSAEAEAQRRIVTILAKLRNHSA
ncbi:PAS domain-containing protein [Streptomyces sp. NPDC001744]|uniref:PAS domain-containing protein n=1 Tax=Streptomyces sp. NPDC001744 TaxID=3364606 RepID=UPI0036891586